jgi:coenzyme F420-reducing hydrogenase alpha subunit
MTVRTIKVDYIARVEGEAALHLSVRDGAVTRAELRIFEPPRFFEAFLRGRNAAETPDITARICGICPVAYQMSAVHAVEAALGIEPVPAVHALRRLLYCGEWIESHALHVYMLHAPDFLGYPSAIHMAKDHPEIVQRGLALKKAGNDIVRVVGGREIHPVNVRVGGFYRAPTRRELATLCDSLEHARDIARETVAWTAQLPIPELHRDYEYVALVHPDEYPMNRGHIESSRGVQIEAAAFEANFEEVHMPYSNALQARRRGGGNYLVGPLARYNLNAARLSPAAREAAQAAGLGTHYDNPFRSIVVRAVEMLHACDEALRIIAGYEEPAEASTPVLWRAATGHAATEAPRGLLYHRYEITADGTIVSARIVPPTSQNQATIEEDLREFAVGWLELDDDALRQRCEQVIRNYDPCISCATHFLRLSVDR